MTQATIPMIESPTPVGRPMMRDKFCCTGSRVVGGAVGVAVGNRTVEGEEIVDCHFKNQFYMYVVSAPGPTFSQQQQKRSAIPSHICWVCMAQERLSLVTRLPPDFIRQPQRKIGSFFTAERYNLRVARGMRLQETNVKNIFSNTNMSPQDKI